MLVPLVEAGREQGGLVVWLTELCHHYWVVCACSISIAAGLRGTWCLVPVKVCLAVGCVGVLLPIDMFWVPLRFWVLLRFVVSWVQVVLGIPRILHHVRFSWIAGYSCCCWWCCFQHLVLAAGSHQHPWGGCLPLVLCCHHQRG